MSTNGSGGPAAPGGSKRLAQQQAQVDEVVDIMRQNVDKVLERDKNLSLLDDRADKLQHNAAQFEQHAGKLKRKFWWKNMKMMIIMGVVGTIFAIVVIAWIASKVKAVTPVLPSGDVTTVPPVVVNNPPPGPVVPPTSGKSPKKFSGKHKSPKTTAATTTKSVAPSDDADDDQEEPKDPVKVAANRVIEKVANKQ